MKKLTVSLFLAAIVTAQPASPTKALSHFIHAVDDLDTTLAFYNNVFGLKGNPSDFTNPAVPLLTNAPGVTLRKLVWYAGCLTRASPRRGSRGTSQSP